MEAQPPDPERDARRDDVRRLTALGWTVPELARRLEVPASVIAADLRATREAQRNAFASGEGIDAWQLAADAFSVYDALKRQLLQSLRQADLSARDTRLSIDTLCSILDRQVALATDLGLFAKRPELPRAAEIRKTMLAIQRTEWWKEQRRKGYNPAEDSDENIREAVARVKTEEVWFGPRYNVEDDRALPEDIRAAVERVKRGEPWAEVWPPPTAERPRE